MLTKRQFLYTTALVVNSLYITACATPEPAIEVRLVEVPVIEKLPCPADFPDRPEPLDTLPDDAKAALAKALSVLAMWSAPGMYGDRAEDYFRACSGE